MLIIDSILSFWYIEFLKEKSVEIALEVLKNFMTEIERLTEQKLMRARVYNCICSLTWGLSTIYWSKAVYLQNLILLKRNLEIIFAKALYGIK